MAATLPDHVPLNPGVRPRTGLCLALILLASFACRMAWFGDQVVDFDEQLYSLIGQRMLQGDLPYVDLWDRKPIGLFALFALAHAIGGPDAIAYQVLAALFATAGAWLVYFLARHLADNATACGVALAYPALINAYGSLSGQSEVFLNPPLLGMVLLIVGMDRGRSLPKAFAAMALGGLALQIKPTAAPQCLALGLMALWHFRALAPGRLALLALAFGLVGLVPSLLTALVYALLGEFDWYWYATFTSNLARVSATGQRLSLEQLQALMPLLAIALGGLYAAWRLNPPTNRRVYGLICLWSLSTLGGIYLLNQVLLYYFAAFVPCALLLALPLLDRKSKLGWMPLAVLLGAAVLLLNLPNRFQETQASRAAVGRLVTAIRPHVSAGGPCLLVFDGPTALYRLTGSCLPSRIVYPDHWNNVMERETLGIDRPAELRRVLAGKPGAIVTADRPVAVQDPDTLALVQRALASDYRPDASATIRGRTYQVWVRRN